MHIPRVHHQRNVSCRGACLGFSLIEVVMAIGIVSFAFVAIFGLIPIGLTNFRNAMDVSLVSQIAQQVVSDVEQTGLSQLQSNNFPIRYFNDQGVQVGDENNRPSASAMAQVIYQVKVSVQSPSPAIAGSSSNLATIIVDVVKNPANKPLQTNTDGVVDDPSNGIYVSKCFAFASQAP